MKELLAKLKFPAKYINLAVISLTVLLSLVVIFFLVMPSFSRWQTTNAALAAEKARGEQIQTNLAVLQKQDPVLVGKIKAFLDTLVPSKLEVIHFTALDELIARAAGASVTDLQVVKAVRKVATPTTPTTTPSNSTSTTTTQALVQTAPTTVKVTYNSNFASMVKLLSYWILADQLVGVIDVNIGSTVGVGNISYTISYELPLATAVSTTVVATERIELTDTEKKAAEELEKRIIFTATPSTVPLGKTNPFL